MTEDIEIRIARLTREIDRLSDEMVKGTSTDLATQRKIHELTKERNELIWHYTI